MTINNLLEKSLEYLKIKFPKGYFVKDHVFDCPICKTRSAQFIPNTDWKIDCSACKTILGNIIEINMQFNGMDEIEAIDDIKKTLKIDFIGQNNKLDLLDKYEKLNWDLTPIVKNQKIPIEKDWLNKEHRSKDEWLQWLIDGNLNIAVKTGAKSNVTIIDIDTQEIPETIKKVTGNTLIQRTARGWHLFYKYDKDLPTTRIVDLDIDILNDGKGCVISPSIVDDELREFINNNDIIEIPKELKDFLVVQLKGKTVKNIYDSNVAEEEFNNLLGSLEHMDFKEVNSGNRHNFLMWLGGVLKKQLNLKQTEFVLQLVNQKFIKPPLESQDLYNTIIKQFEKYHKLDENSLANKIIGYLRHSAEDLSSKDIASALKEEKIAVDKALKFLVQEGIITKQNRFFHLVSKVEWKDTFMDENKPISFKMPFFGDMAVFREGDLVVIGGLPGTGKTHLAVNIMKRLIAQKIKPYYVSTENGTRLFSIAKELGMRESEFYWTTCYNAEEIELNHNAITIIDWLLPTDYSQTDKIFRKLADQLLIKKGLLIVFVQLMNDGSFFAKNLLEFFPAFTTKFLYDGDTGEESHFEICKVRESKGRKMKGNIPLKYDWRSKQLLMVDELQLKVVKSNDKTIV